MIVTVTLNAAIDRTLLVPNFQLGHRHRASSTSLSSAGGKGINVARSLKRLGVPVVSDGPRRRANRRSDRRAPDERGPAERLRANPRRVAHLDGGRRPDLERATRRSTSGGRRSRSTSSRSCATSSRTLTRGAEFVVFSGSLPRGVDDDFYLEAIREANRRGVPTVLDSEGEPLRRGVEAEPYLVTPNVREAEQLVGHEFGGDDDLVAALDEIVELGARNVLITHADGCLALFRERPRRAAGRRLAPRLEPISKVGSGDALLAGFLAARMAGKAIEEAVRAGGRDRRRVRARGGRRPLRRARGEPPLRARRREATSSRSPATTASPRARPARGRARRRGWYDALEVER